MSPHGRIRTKIESRDTRKASDIADTGNERAIADFDEVVPIGAHAERARQMPGPFQAMRCIYLVCF